MHAEQTVYLVGCQTSTLNMLISAFQKAGIQAVPADYQDKFGVDGAPDCLLVYLTEDDISSAHLLLNQPGLENTKKLLIIDPRNKPCRQFSAAANIDDLIFKPVRLKELISRIQLILSREIVSPDGKSTVCDEIDFAQRMQEFSDASFSGVFRLNGHDLDAEVIFQKGVVKGIKAGLKIQKNAVDAVWRIFPASHAESSGAALPAWCKSNPLNLKISEIVDHVIQTSTYFHDRLSENYSLQTVFKINSSTYDEAFDSLPRQVRQIIQTFDGTKTLREVFDTLNLSEYLIMQIIVRLLDERLIVECEPAPEKVSFSDWIHSDASLNEDDLNALSGLGTEDEFYSGEEATPSAMFYIDQMRPVSSASEQEPAQEQEDKAFSERLDEGKKDNLSEIDNGQLSYDRASITLHLATAHEPFFTSECIIKKDTYYDDEFLEKEADADANKPLGAGDVLKIQSSFFYGWQENKDGEDGVELDLSDLSESEDDLSEDDVSDDSEDELEDDMSDDSEGESEDDVSDDSEGESEDDLSDASENEEDEDDEEVDGDWFDEDSHDSLHADRSFSPIKLYKQNHAAELSPEEWKANTIARLAEERKKKDALIMRILVTAIIVALIVLIIVVSSRDNGEDAAVPANEKVAQKSAEPEFPSPEPVEIKADMQALNAQTPEAVVAPNAGESGAGEPEPNAGESGAIAGEPEPNAGESGAIAGEPARNAGENGAIAGEPEPNAGENGAIAGEPARNAGENGAIAGEPVPSADGAKVVRHEKAARAAAPTAPNRENTAETRPSSSGSGNAKKAEAKTAETVVKAASAKSGSAASNANSGNINAQLQPVRDAINKKDLNAAWNQLQPILKSNPNHPTVLNMAVQIASRQGNNEQALEYLKKLESSSGSKAAYWRQRAKLHKALGQADEALKAEEKANALGN